MSVVLQHDGKNQARITLFRKRADTPKYEGQPNTLINPDLSTTITKDPQNWLVDSNGVREMTEQEKELRDSKIKQDARDVINADNLPKEILAIINIMETLKPGSKNAVKAEYIRLLEL